MSGQTAVFVDGENIGSDHAKAIASTAMALGPVSIRRVYGNAAKIPGWDAALGFRLVHSQTGKNAADIALSIDAMEIALTLAPENVVIASSDRDFTHLATRLRERGHHVLGVGLRKAPEAFRAACSDFHLLESSTPPTGAALDKAIRDAISSASREGRGMKINDLSAVMRRDHNLCISKLKEGKWRNYLAERPQLFEMDPKGPDAHVRFKPKGFAS